MKKKVCAGMAALCLMMAGCAGSQDVADSREPEQEMVQTPEEAQTSEETGAQAEECVEGIVVDAAMHSLTICTAQGELVSAGIPEDGNHLSDGLLLGISVKLVYENGELKEIADGDLQPKASREALEFAADVMLAMEYQDMDALAALNGYPVYVNVDGGQVIEDAEAFLALGAEAVFAPERVQAVRAANLYELSELDGGKYVLGDGSPNVTFQKDEGNDRGFSVTGIN